MREDENTTEHDEILDLGAASELTQGAYLPGATEAINIKDHWDEP